MCLKLAKGIAFSKSASSASVHNAANDADVLGLFGLQHDVGIPLLVWVVGDDA